MRKREMQGCTFMSEKKMNAWSNMNAMKHTHTIQQQQNVLFKCAGNYKPKTIL